MNLSDDLRYNLAPTFTNVRNIRILSHILKTHQIVYQVFVAGLLDY